jgi:hypothetical protein
MDWKTIWVSLTESTCPESERNQNMNSSIPYHLIPSSMVWWLDTHTYIYGTMASPFFSLWVVVGWDWVHVVRQPLLGLKYQPRMIDECGAVYGMRIGRGNWNAQRKHSPILLCPPQIPYGLTCDRTQAAALGSRRITVWAMARSYASLTEDDIS